jgi:cobalt-zinc-cadmium efflux system membrane fusion protein
MDHSRTNLSTWLVCGCCLLFVGCHPKHKNDSIDVSQDRDNKQNISYVSPDSGSLKHIQVERSSLRSLPFVIDASGQLQANANVVSRISSPLSGKVKEVHATIGEHVKAGQILASVTSQEVGALITDFFKAETELESDLSRDLLEIDYEVEQEQAELELSEKQYERTRVLVEEKISSRAELERLRTVLDKHKLTVAALEKKRVRLKEVTENKKRLGRSSLEQKLTLLGVAKSTVESILNKKDVVNTIPIRSPQSGFVLERNVNVGELVDPAKILFVVDDIDNLWLIADVFEQDVESVSKGQLVEFTVDSFPKERFTGALDFVAGTINPETRTLAIRATVTNPHLKLKPKMFARLKIFTGNETVLAVPKGAIQDAGSKKVVYVQVAPGKFQERPVKLGDEASGFIHVKEGLKEGELIATKGAFSLRSQILKQSR